MLIHKISGCIFAPRSTSAVEAQVWFDEKNHFWIETNSIPPKKFRIQNISSPIKGISNQIWFRDGRKFVTDEILPTNFYSETAIYVQQFAKWENFSLSKLFIIIISFIGIIILYQRCISLIADTTVTIIPRKWDILLGEKVWRSLDPLLFTSTTLNSKEELELYKIFTPLQHMLVKQGFKPKLELRNSSILGANAIALPGGIIIITDELWHLMKDQPENVQAILAHEVDHVLRRHSIRQLIRRIGVSWLILSFGVEDLIIEKILMILSHGIMASYSRDFETEADLGAVQLLKDINQDPRSIIKALDLLRLEFYDEKKYPKGNWFNSHPDINQRIRNLQLWQQVQ